MVVVQVDLNVTVMRLWLNSMKVSSLRHKLVAPLVGVGVADGKHGNQISSPMSKPLAMQ
jgi:hypothetical protein